jgi:hypothetical protein
VFLTENEEEEEEEYNSNHNHDDDSLQPGREGIVVVGVGEV